MSVAESLSLSLSVAEAVAVIGGMEGTVDRREQQEAQQAREQPAGPGDRPAGTAYEGKAGAGTAGAGAAYERAANERAAYEGVTGHSSSVRQSPPPGARGAAGQAAGVETGRFRT
ncbi:hypothetical protein [Streptomyces sp. NPDC054787]